MLIFILKLKIRETLPQSSADDSPLKRGSQEASLSDEVAIASLFEGGGGVSRRRERGGCHEVTGGVRQLKFRRKKYV